MGSIETLLHQPMVVLCLVSLSSSELLYEAQNDRKSSFRILQEATTAKQQVLRRGSWALINLLPLLWVETMAERVAVRYPDWPSWIAGDAPVFRIVTFGKARNGKLHVPNKLSLRDLLSML